MQVNLKKIKELSTNHGPVLITGHTGFKGSWLTKLLDYMSISWVGISHESNQSWLHHEISNKISNEISGDIRCKPTIEHIFDIYHPSIVIHMAAQSIVSVAEENITETFSINMLGTSILFDVFKHSSALHLAAITTDKVYKNDESKSLFIETDNLWGNEAYSASKVGTELVVDVWKKKLLSAEPSKSVSILRSGNVVGGGDLSQNRLIPDLVRGIMSKSPTEIRNLNSTRPWLHVLDTLWGYLLAIENSLTESKNNTFNFAPYDKSLSVAEVIDIFAQSLNTKPSIKILEGEKLFFESTYLELDSSKAQLELGWKPILTQEEAIKKTGQWWEAYITNEEIAKNLVEREIEEYLHTVSM